MSDDRDNDIRISTTDPDNRYQHFREGVRSGLSQASSEKRWMSLVTFVIGLAIGGAAVLHLSPPVDRYRLMNFGSQGNVKWRIDTVTGEVVILSSRTDLRFPVEVHRP